MPAPPRHDSAGIICRDVTRSFRSVRALTGFTADFPRGKVTGLVGPNGAGKTTLLLILAGLLRSDGGSVRVLDIDPAKDPFDVHAAVGWMPDFFGVYDDLTPLEYLELFAAAHRVPALERRERAGEVLALVGLDASAAARVHTLSRGQKQALGFARTLLHRPRVLLLDEPAAGLDPRARIWLRALIRREADRGATVVVSSHILTELEEMVDVVVFVDAGRCRGVLDRSELRRPATGMTLRLRAIDPAALGAALKKARVKAEWLDGERVSITVRDDRSAARLIARIVAAGVPLVEAAPEETDLEGAYLALSEEPPS